MAAPPPTTSPPTGTTTTPTTSTTPQPPTTTTTPIPPPTTTTTPPITTSTSTIGLPPPITTSTTTSTSLSTSSVPTTTSSTTSLTTILSTSEAVSTSGGNVVTITSVTTASTRDVAPTGFPNGGTNSSHSSNGFFSNKGAVAGVFTVVGLIALVILIALITNAIRRRRAKRFDEETAAAARDAANTQIPNFAYADDDDDYRPGGYGSGTINGAKYSDASHGTYAQAPMAVPESYGMREMAPHGPNPGEYFDPGVMDAAAGAAGIGVARARSMRDGGYAAGLTEGAAPYPAFAAPGSNYGHSQYPHGMIRGAGGPEFDLGRRPSQVTQQTDYSALSRNKSYNGAQSAIAPSYHSDQSYIPPSTDSESAYSQGNQGGYPNSFNAFATNGQQRLQTIPAARSEEDLSAAYGGYTSEPLEPRVAHSSSPPPGPLPNPFSTPTGLHDDFEGRSDDEDEPRRVLKVANE